MTLKSKFAFLILVSIFSSLVAAENVVVTIKGVTSIATTDNHFVCATMDWWTSDKCNYGQCPWEGAGIFNLDLNNKILMNAVEEFDHLRIRVGGSLQDQVVYDVWKKIKNCRSFKVKSDGLFGFSSACLSMERWDQLNSFFNKSGAFVTFGLNALMGRKESNTEQGLWEGKWKSKNAEELMKYSLKKGYHIDSFELGNELCGNGVAARVNATQYAKDMKNLKKVVQKVYHEAGYEPAVLGPGGFYDKTWFNTFLQASGPNVVDGISHHIYNLGPGVDPDLVNKVQDPFYLSEIAQTFLDVKNTIRNFGPWAKSWVGEAGGAYNSGGKDVSHTFADGFWYLDQLGMSSVYNHKVYCRQALIGGNYGLLNTTSFVPNPDYYGALLWDRLMGSRVLATSHQGPPQLRVYSHCAKKKPGVTILFINLSKSDRYDISLINDMNLEQVAMFSDMNSEQVAMFKGYQEREEYHLTPKDGNIQSDVVLLNGSPLKLTECLEIPKLHPKLVKASSPISIQPHSLVYVNIKDFHAPTCA